MLSFRCLLILVFLAGAAGGAFAEELPTEFDALVDSLLGKVNVAQVDIVLSSDPKEISSQLVEFFKFHSLPENYSKIEIPCGAHVWPIFKKRLLVVAKNSKFDQESLGRILDQIEEEEKLSSKHRQILPVGAFLAHQGKRPVWVIPCKWEFSCDEKKDPRPVSLGHYRVWAFFADTAEKAGFTTCR